MHAVRMACYGQAELIADTLYSTFRTNLTWDGVLSMVLLLLDQRWDLGNFLQQRALQTFCSGLTPAEVLSEVIHLLEHFSEV